MKKLLLVLGCMMSLAVLGTGCMLLEQYQDTIKDKIVSALEDQGVDAASAKIDELVSAGTLTAAQGAALKEALPLGVEKVKEILNQTEE
ncbi:MAG: hypothetical protein AB7F40_04255 [Victivallaceae bacterium]